MQDYPISLAPVGLNVPESPMNGVYVTLPDVSGLGGLPACGTITFRYIREGLNLRGTDQLSANLCLCEVTAVEAGDECEEKQEDVVDKLFAAAKEEKESDDSDGSGDSD